MPDIKLYELAPTRSARCRWILLETGLPYESIDRGPAIFGSDELKAVHPLGKLPAAVIDGKPLFESAAIATAIADLVPEQNLVAKPGTWSRTLHDQWVSYALTELEAWMWSSAINTFMLAEELRIPAVIDQNAAMFARGAAGMDAVLADVDYLVDDRFSVTDIIAAYAVNWGRLNGLLEGFENLNDYLERLFVREHCTLNTGEPG